MNAGDLLVVPIFDAAASLSKQHLDRLRRHVGLGYSSGIQPGLQVKLQVQKFRVGDLTRQ